MRKRNFALLLFSVLFATKLVSAQLPGYEFLDFLENPLIKFILISALFFAIIFYSANRFFRGNSGVSAIVALVSSILASSFILRQGYVYGFFDFIPDDVSAWVALIALAVFLALVAFLLVRYVRSCAGRVLTLIGVWLLLNLINLNDYIFGSELADNIALVHGVLTHVAVLAILVILLVICFVRK